MKSYPYETPSSLLGYAAQQLAMPEILAGECGHDVDCGQPPLRYQPENPYIRRLIWHLIATTLLATITVLTGLSLIGFPPDASAHTAARTDPTKQSIAAATSLQYGR
jgi:hypothetical protein